MPLLIKAGGIGGGGDDVVPEYAGQCHCGANRFIVEADIDHVRECDCSVCRRRGTLIYRVGNDSIRFLTPLAQLTTYRWGSGTGTDYFCRVCGILPFRRPSAPTREELDAGMKCFDGWSVNVRCLDGLDLDSIPRVKIAGSQLKLPDRI